MTAGATNAVVNNLFDKIGQAVQNMTPAAQRLFALYVRQAYIGGWEAIIGGGCLFLFGVLLWVAALRDSNWSGEWEGGGGGAAFPLALFGCVAILGAIVVATFAGIPRLLNPEYFAWQSIIATITPGR